MKQKPDVGIVVGRFQTPALHEGHLDLLRQVAGKHKKVIVLLGLSPTKVNPLDFEARKQMILREFPDFNVLYIKDCISDELWSKRLDGMIDDLLTPSQTAILYGSRDSFISHYRGTHETEELVPSTYVSGTEIRKEISRTVQSSFEFRAGVVWAMHNQWPKTYPTVDVVIYNTRGEILVARKPDETKFRFIGGFAMPNSPSYEDDAIREAKEEAGVDIKDLVYIGSFKIDDWRYRAETDKIKTTFFAAKYEGGGVMAADDVCEVKWLPVHVCPEFAEQFEPVHKGLVEAFLNYHRIEGYRYLLKMD
jgi:bifunctional NMN adenylyltransferase/nudix hydrolase